MRPSLTLYPLLLLLLLFLAAGTLAIEELICPKNHSVVEVTGDAVLSVFVDTDYGPECNISSPKSIQEVATAMFVAQTLNRMEYVPGVTIGLRLYDTCNDRISVYKQALISAVEMDCSAHYDLGILAPERYSEVLEPLRSLDIIPVNTYAGANLTRPLLDILVDFVATRYSSVDLVLSSSRRALDRFLDASKEAGICVKSDKAHEADGNATEVLVVALGDYDDISAWLDEEEIGDEGDKKIWIVLALDNSHVDDLIPEGSFVVKPEPFHLDLGPEIDAGDVSRIPVAAIMHSPHLLGVGKAIVEIAKSLLQLQTRSCPYGMADCTLPRFDVPERASLSNADLYENLKVPAKSHSTKYVVGRKLGDAVAEMASYIIDATSARYRVMAEREVQRLPRLCLKKLATRCELCLNFQVRERDDDDYADEDEDAGVGTFKRKLWVPIFLTIVSCLSLACLCALGFIAYRFFVEPVLDGNPLLTILLIVATVLMLLSLVPFCLEDRAVGAQQLNARKIFACSLSFGLAFSVMLTRALFLAFSRSGAFGSHINGYLQGCMLFFMAGLEVAISGMYFALSNSDAARVVRGPAFIGLLGYDILLLLALFATCCFTSHVQRNYHEGACFFATAIGLLMTWALWISCFLLTSPDQRDLVVCYGILGSACLIVLGILVPRTYFMLSHFTRTADKDFMGRFEVADLPDPRMNSTARQALDLQSRQPFYEYVQQPMQANYYGSASPNKLEQQPYGSLRGRRSQQLQSQRSPEPRRTPGYNNYGFRPEMRELEQAYVIPRLYVDESDVSRIQSVVKQEEPPEGASAAPEARYALPRSLLRKARGLAGSIKRGVSRRGGGAPGSSPSSGRPIETEVYVQERISPRRLGPDERFPPARSPSPRLAPSHASIREEEDITRVTRF